MDTASVKKGYALAAVTSLIVAALVSFASFWFAISYWLFFLACILYDAALILGNKVAARLWGVLAFIVALGIPPVIFYIGGLTGWSLVIACAIVWFVQSIIARAVLNIGFYLYTRPLIKQTDEILAQADKKLADAEKQMKKSATKSRRRQRKRIT